MGEAGASTLGCCFSGVRARHHRAQQSPAHELAHRLMLLASSRIKLALQAMRHQDRQSIGEVFVGLHRGVLLMLITFT